jgi:hypothetical protein
MGWRSISKTGEIRYEGHTDPERGGRPVAQGEEGNLLFIEQYDYGHRVGIDLTMGIILFDYENEVGIQNGTLEVANPKYSLWLCDETSFVGEMASLSHVYELKRDEKGRKVHDDKGNLVEVRTDILTPLVFRPIWFSRHISTLPAPVKVIGLQTTLPELQGGANIKLMVSLYYDGRIGISA